jgi:ribonuclease T
VIAAGYSFDSKEAHSAVYDAERTALLFCRIVNRLRTLETLELERVGAALP